MSETQVQYCIQCGTRLPAGARFCAKCGSETVAPDGIGVPTHVRGPAGVADGPAPHATVSSQPSSGGELKRTHWLLAAAVVGVVVVAGAVISIVASGGDDQPATEPVADATSPSASSATTTQLATTAAPTTTVVTVNPKQMFVVVGVDEEPPPFPDAVVGYAREGDLIRSSSRIFEGNGVSMVYDFPDVGMGHCGDVVWTLRWQVRSDAPIALSGMGSFLTVDQQTDFFSNGPDIRGRADRPGGGGYMLGDGCSIPVFAWDIGTGDPTGSNLADLDVEYLVWVKAVGAGSAGSTNPVPSSTEPANGGSATPPAGGNCPSMNFTDELPFTLCDESIALTYVQAALNDFGGYGLEPDGQYGPATQRAVWEYQRASGLPATGECDLDTWVALVGYSGIPGNDLNGDGILTPEELIWD